MSPERLEDLTIRERRELHRHRLAQAKAALQEAISARREAAERCRTKDPTRHAWDSLHRALHAESEARLEHQNALALSRI